MLDFLSKLDNLERRIERALPEPSSTSGQEQFARFRDDFLGFTALLDIVDKDAVRRKLIPNSIQSAFEQARTGRDIILKPRQIGFTTWELARDLWFFLTREGARVVVVVQSQSEHNALNETSEKVRIMLEGLAQAGFDINFSTEARGTWVCGDASLRIVEAGASTKAASKKGRGGTIHRLHLTEPAFYEQAEVTLNAMLECVPDISRGTEITIESTANGAAGAYFERYQRAKDGADGYKPLFICWLEHDEYSTPLEPGETIVPETKREKALIENYGASLAQLKWYRKKVADKKQDLVDQEYPIDEETCWLIAGRLFFNKERSVVIRAQTTAPIAIEQRGALRIWKKPEPRKSYVIIADPSEGLDDGDPAVAIVLDRETGEHVATLHGVVEHEGRKPEFVNFEPGKLAEIVAEIGTAYNLALIVVERNNHGHATLLALREREEYPNIYVDPHDERPGWLSTETTRSTALDMLEDAHRTARWTTPDKKVAGELLTFIVNKKGKAEAASGAHDDLVMVSAIGHNICSRPILRIPAPKASGDRRWADSGRGF